MGVSVPVIAVLAALGIRSIRRMVDPHGQSDSGRNRNWPAAFTPGREVSSCAYSVAAMLDVTQAVNLRRRRVLRAAFCPCRHHRQRVRRPCRGGAAGRARLSRHRAGKARCARRAGLCAPHRRVHLRCRPDHPHRAISAGRSLEARRPPAGRRYRPAADGPVLPADLQRRQPARLSGDPARVRAEVARLSPGDVAGYERFMALSNELCRIGFEELGHVPFNSFMDMVRVAPDLLKVQAWRSVWSIVSGAFPRSAAAHRLQLPSAADRRQPAEGSSIYGMIEAIQQRWGVHFAMGGTGAVVAGLVRLIEGQGNVVRCNAEVAEITLDGRRATGVRLASGEHIAADIVVSNADSAFTYKRLLPATARRRWTDRKLDRSQLLQRACSSGISARAGNIRTWRTTPSCSARAIEELLKDIFDRKIAGQGFQRLPAPADRHRPLARPAGLRHVLCAVAGAAHGRAASTGRCRPSRTGRRLRNSCNARCCPDLRTARRGLARHHAARFPGPPAVRSRAPASGWSRCCCKAPGSGRTTAARISSGCILVGAGTHPGAGVPGVISSARVLDMVVPDAAALR